VTWLIFGSAWYLAHTPTTKVMLGLLAVRYNRLPIMVLYKLWSTATPSSSLDNFKWVGAGVLLELAFSIPNFFTMFLAYLLWECMSVLPQDSSQILIASGEQNVEPSFSTSHWWDKTASAWFTDVVIKEYHSDRELW
jgi:hypothetical protein